MASSSTGTGRLHSKTHFVQVAEGTSMLVRLLIVPDHAMTSSSIRTAEQCLWFQDKHLQELLVLAHQLVCTVSQSTFLSLPSKTTQLNFARSGNMRVLYSFEEGKIRQSLLQLSGCGSCIPDVTIMTKYGRRVFPPWSDSPVTDYSDHRSYKSYGLLTTSLVMYVDEFVLPSTMGVVKIRRALEPGYIYCKDIASYFKMEEDTLFDQSGPLAKVPVAQLTKRRGRKYYYPKSLKTRREQSVQPKKSPSSRSVGSVQQTIPAALASVAVSSESDKQEDTTSDCLIPSVPEDLLDELLLAELTSSSSPPATPSTPCEPTTPSCSTEPVAHTQQPRTACSTSGSEDLADTEIQTKTCQTTTNDLLDDLFSVTTATDADCSDQDKRPSSSYQPDSDTSSVSTALSDVVDLTVSSGEDNAATVSLSSTTTIAQDQKMEKKMQRVSSVLFKDCSEIKDISLLNLRKWLKFRKQTLVEIYSGSRPSDRHAKFINTSALKRNSVLQNAVNTAMLSPEQLNALSSDVVNMFCAEDESQFTYAWLVMFPEALVYLHMDFLQISYEQAEQQMYSYTALKH